MVVMHDGHVLGEWLTYVWHMSMSEEIRNSLNIIWVWSSTEIVLQKTGQVRTTEGWKPRRRPYLPHTVAGHKAKSGTLTSAVSGRRTILCWSWTTTCRSGRSRPCSGLSFWWSAGPARWSPTTTGGWKPRTSSSPVADQAELRLKSGKLGRKSKPKMPVGVAPSWPIKPMLLFQ